MAEQGVTPAPDERDRAAAQKQDWMVSYFAGSMPVGREAEAASDAWDAARAFERARCLEVACRAVCPACRDSVGHIVDATYYKCSPIRAAFREEEGRG